MLCESEKCTERERKKTTIQNMHFCNCIELTCSTNGLLAKLCKQVLYNRYDGRVHLMQKNVYVEKSQAYRNEFRVCVLLL